MEEETYIGDGIYASWVRGPMIKLRCAAPSALDIMYLESSVYAALKKFVETPVADSDGF